MNDDKLIEKRISTENVFDGVLLHVKKDVVELPNGHQAPREWIKHQGASAVIPLFPNGDIILVKQFRYPINQVTIEIPAGKLDHEGENPLECAERELSEETGYTAGKIWKLTSIATTVGFSNEWIHIYAAEDLKSGKQHPDDDEFINYLKVPLKDAIKMIDEGKIFDSKTVIAILLLERELNKK